MIRTIALEADPAGLALLLDLILPGDDLLPAARALPEFPELLDRAITASDGSEEIVLHFSRQAVACKELSVNDLEAWSAADAEHLVFVLQAAYFMSRTVRDLLGYPGQGRRPIAEATPEERVDDTLLRPVIERGPIFVDPQDFPSSLMSDA